MKQKFLIVKGGPKSDTIIKEHAELEKKIFSPVFEKSYETAALKKAVKAGIEELTDAIRTPDFYPPQNAVTKIATAITELFEDSKRDSIEVLVDDMDKPQEEPEAEVEEESDIDELLEDDLEKPDSDDSPTPDDEKDTDKKK